jgi:hypothetical protein
VIRYDEALPKFAALVRDARDNIDLSDQVFLRDAAGRLTYVVRSSLEAKVATTIREGAAALAPWVDLKMPLATPEELFDPSLGGDEPGFPEYIVSESFTGYVRLAGC